MSKSFSVYRWCVISWKDLIELFYFILFLPLYPVYIPLQKGLVEWDVYRIQRNITTSIYKKSQATYFSERCEGGAKNQKFWKTIKPFLTCKQPSCQNIILKEDDKIITDEREICDIFNDFFPHVAMDIGFKDDMPDDFKTADGFAKIIDKHSNHPSIIKIR